MDRLHPVLEKAALFKDLAQLLDSLTFVEREENVAHLYVLIHFSSYQSGQRTLYDAWCGGASAQFLVYRAETKVYLSISHYSLSFSLSPSLSSHLSSPLPICFHQSLSTCFSLSIFLYKSLCLLALFFYLSGPQYTCLSVYQSFCRSIYLSISLYVCLSIYLFISAYASIYLPACLSVPQSFFRSACLFSTFLSLLLTFCQHFFLFLFPFLYFLACLCNLLSISLLCVPPILTLAFCFLAPFLASREDPWPLLQQMLQVKCSWLYSMTQRS